MILIDRGVVTILSDCNTVERAFTFNVDQEEALRQIIDHAHDEGHAVGFRHGLERAADRIMSSMKGFKTIKRQRRF